MKVNETIYCIDARNGVLIPELSHTIQGKPSGGRSLNCTPNIMYQLNPQANEREHDNGRKDHLP